MIPCIYHKLPNKGNLFVAFSGGLDSSLLLYMLHMSLKKYGESERLKAIHIDHGIHTDSAAWARHCVSVCEQLNIPIYVEKVNIPSTSNLECQARDARQSAFKDYLKDDTDHLCLAHHLSDQAETILYRLIRGAGVKGLSAMQSTLLLNNMNVLRPLMNYPKSMLLEWEKLLPFKPIDDPSNLSLDFDRNFLRHEVMPRLKERWPTVEESFSRTASLCSEMEAVLNESISLHIQNFYGTSQNTLSVKALLSVSNSYRCYLIRYWLHSMGYHGISQKMHRELDISVLNAKIDASPVLQIKQHEFRRYRDDLYFIHRIPSKTTDTTTYPLQSNLPLKVKDGRIYLVKFDENNNLKVRFRGKSDNLKSIFQKYGVPPWLRNITPLIYDDQENLQAIVGFWHSNLIKEIQRLH